MHVAGSTVATMPPVRRVLAALVPSVVVLAVTAGPAQAASIWTPVASGTTQDITAVQYRSDAQAWFGTSNGAMFRSNGAGGFVPATSTPGPGNTVTDVSFNAAGTVGYATTTTGKIYRSTDAGDHWTSLTLPTVYNSCSSLPAGVVPMPPLYRAAWASDDSLLYVVGGAAGMSPVLLRITNPGTLPNPTLTNANQASAASGCKVGPRGATGDALTDAFVLPGNPQYVTVIHKYFGELDTTTDGFATVPTHYGAGTINGYTGAPRLAIDPNNPNRLWAVDHSGAGSSQYFEYSEDAGANAALMQIGGGVSVTPNLYGVAYAGGTLLAVGDTGQILTSTNGTIAYLQPADGALAATKWQAVSLADTTHALVGGAGGALVKSTAANTIPDTTPPAGTISGPLTPRVGVAAAYTLTATDNAGGSGVDPASVTWSATGAAAASGNPASLTFTGTGFATITASFRDNAGNAATATLSVNVGAASVVPPVVPPVTPPGPPTKSTTTKVPGGTITLGTPKACVPKNSSFSVRLSLKRRNAKGVIVTKITKAKFYVDGKLKKTDKKPTFTQKLTVKKLKAGSKHKVKATAYIRMSNKKTRTKSISTTFTVCK